MTRIKIKNGQCVEIKIPIWNKDAPITIKAGSSENPIGKILGMMREWNTGENKPGCCFTETSGKPVFFRIEYDGSLESIYAVRQDERIDIIEPSEPIAERVSAWMREFCRAVRAEMPENLQKVADTVEDSILPPFLYVLATKGRIDSIMENKGNIEANCGPSAKAFGKDEYRVWLTDANHLTNWMLLLPDHEYMVTIDNPRKYGSKISRTSEWEYETPYPVHAGKYFERITIPVPKRVRKETAMELMLDIDRLVTRIVRLMDRMCYSCNKYLKPSPKEKELRELDRMIFARIEAANRIGIGKWVDAEGLSTWLEARSATGETVMTDLYGNGQFTVLEMLTAHSEEFLKIARRDLKKMIQDAVPSIKNIHTGHYQPQY